jgi:hypothetical protein
MKEIINPTFEIIDNCEYSLFVKNRDKEKITHKNK